MGGWGPTDVENKIGWGPTDVENKIKSLTGVQHCSDQLWLLPAFGCSSFSISFKDTKQLCSYDGRTDTQSLGREKDTDQGVLK